MARVSPAASVHLSRHAQIVTHTFILEAVGGEQFCVRVRVLCAAESAAFKCQCKTLCSTSAWFSLEALAVNLLARRWEKSIWKKMLLVKLDQYIIF